MIPQASTESFFHNAIKTLIELTASTITLRGNWPEPYERSNTATPHRPAGLGCLIRVVVAAEL